MQQKTDEINLLDILSQVVTGDAFINVMICFVCLVIGSLDRDVNTRCEQGPFDLKTDPNIKKILN